MTYHKTIQGWRRLFITFCFTWILCCGADNCPAQDQITSPLLTGPDLSVTTAAGAKHTDLGKDWDASQYIDIDEIKPAMRGYGLTVFSGSKIEKFEVEAISVIHNIEPKRNAIIIRCLDERFYLSKMVQGVSGSPVFFQDRLAGAMAFGWAYSEEPIYGVTPIREMLTVRHSIIPNSAPDDPTTTSRRSALDYSFYTDMMRPKLFTAEQIRQIAVQAGLAQQTSNESHDLSGMVQLPAALTLGGFSGKTLQTLQQHIPGLLGQANLTGSGSLSMAQGAADNITLLPGASLTVPLITGDMSGQVLGTVTEVAGDEVFAFGHSWNGDGPTTWPMGTGYIHTFISKKDASFKLGEAVKIVGAIKSDQAPGVYGRIGAEAPLVPMQIQVQWFDRNEPEIFNVQIAEDEQRDAILAVLVVANTLLFRGDLPYDHTILYETEIRFDKLAPVKFENISSGSGISDIYGDVYDPVMLVLGNPWQKIKLTSINVKAHVLDRDSVWTIKSAQLGRLIYHPGEKISAQLTLMPHRAAEKKLGISLELPWDIKPGKYKIYVGSLDNYLLQLRRTQPHRFRAYTPQQVQQILQERLSLARNRIYITMALPQPSVALESEEFPYLPQSKALLLTDKSRRIITTKFLPLLSAQTDTEGIIYGSADFDIEVVPD